MINVIRRDNQEKLCQNHVRNYPCQEYPCGVSEKSDGGRTGDPGDDPVTDRDSTSLFMPDPGGIAEEFAVSD